MFAIGAVTGAALNAAILLLPSGQGGVATAMTLRFGTGVSLALVYPVGMKIMATWTREDRGLGLGLLVGALTVGSASPHLVRGLGGVGAWEPVLFTVSGFAVLGALIVWRWGELGPYRAEAPRFRWRYMGEALRERSLRLANLGYLGHMWELYSMWTWLPLFLAEAYRGYASRGMSMGGRWRVAPSGSQPSPRSGSLLPVAWVVSWPAGWPTGGVGPRRRLRAWS